jgi:hypothetical protein
MPAATQIFQLYASQGDPLPFVTLTVPTSEMDNLQAAIRNGEWWCNPANPQDQRHMVGIARYVVSAGT